MTLDDEYRRYMEARRRTLLGQIEELGAVLDPLWAALIDAITLPVLRLPKRIMR